MVIIALYKNHYYFIKYNFILFVLESQSIYFQSLKMESQLVNQLKTLKVAPKDLEILSDYFSIVHHTKGRIRLRASLKLKEVAKTSNPQEILKLLTKIPCILSVKFNALIGSLTIHYDSNIIEPKLWEDCIKGESLEKIAEIINTNLKEIV